MATVTIRKPVVCRAAPNPVGAKTRREHARPEVGSLRGLPNKVENEDTRRGQTTRKHRVKVAPHKVLQFLG